MQTLGQPKVKPQLWTGTTWVDAPGDAANGLKVQGPLTDTQLRAAAVPVSGPLTDAQLRAAVVPVSMASQTPDVTDRDARLLGRAKILDPTGVVIDPPVRAQLPAALAAGGGLKVEGVAGGVAQPVSGPLTDTQLRASAVPVSGPLTDAQLRAAAVPISAPVLTKATQGANGFSTQDLKDSGRVAITITAFQLAGVITTEALMAATQVRAADGVAAAGAAQFTVTAAKRFRIQSITVTVKNTAAAAGTSKLALRYRPAGGTVVITDSIVAILDIGSNNATAANYIGPYMLQIPDGFEMIAGATFGFTNLSSAVTMLHTITLMGFEY